MLIKFIKCHGTSNDFVLIDERADKNVSENNKPVIARALCDRDGPVGADGILFMSDSDNHDMCMRMFNPDGTEPETCANGIRCAARFMFEATGKTRGTIELTGGRSSVSLVDDQGVYTVSATVGPFFIDRKDFPTIRGSAPSVSALPELFGTKELFLASAPNPHIVSMVPRQDKAELIAKGEKIESGCSSLPNRANLSFLSPLSKGKMFVRTYERGAGLTLSCGSATATSALYFFDSRLPDQLSDTVEIYTDGGLVSARRIEREDQEVEIEITGNATFVYQATIKLDFESGNASDFVQGTINLDEIMSFNQVFEESQKQLESV